MDEQALEQLLECSVCLERLDHTSKVLPCQHTFCRRCLEEILSTKRELRCPECRTVVTIRVEDLPPNILLVRLLEGLKTQGQVLGQTSNTESSTQRQDSPSSTSSNVQPRQQRQNVPCAKALYTYEAKESGDLSFKKNEIVLLRKQIDDNWFHGELNGQHGFFPVNYVQVILPLPQQPQCQALFDFDLKDEKEKDCLAFLKDEVLTVIRRVDDNWIEGKKGDKIGIFPVTFVKLNDAAKSLMNSKSSASIQANTQSGGRNSDNNGSTVESHRVTSPSVTSVNPSLLASHPTSQQQKRHSFTLAPQKSPSPPTQHQRRSLELSSSGAFSIPSTSAGPVSGTSTPPLPAPATIVTTCSSSTSNLKSPQQALQVSTDSSTTVSPVTTASSSGNGNSGDNTSVLPSGLTPVYVAQYSYKPQKDDELELRKGDTYTVSEKCQDGWFKGQCLKTGNTGVFPGNYVQLVRHQSAFKPVSPNVMNIRARAPIPTPSSHSSASPDAPGGVSTNLDLTRTSAVSNTANSHSSSQSAAPPPLLPRAPKIYTSPPSNSSSHSSRAAKAAITVPPPGYNSSSSKSSSSHGAAPSQGPAHSTTAVHLPKRGTHSSSPSGGWSQSSLAAMHHSMSASTNITPPNVVLGATGDTHHSHSSKEKKEKKDRHEKDSSKERKDKEKKSLVKRLASKSKKSKSPGDDSETVGLVDASVTHVRSGSYPESGAGAGDSGQHKKTGSFDSSASPPPSAKPSRPKPLAREKYRCIVPYPPQTEHELELQTGDIVYVHKRRDDGWFKGTLTRSGKTGLFPGSFVEKCE